MKSIINFVVALIIITLISFGTVKYFSEESKAKRALKKNDIKTATEYYLKYLEKISEFCLYPESKSVFAKPESIWTKEIREMLFWPTTTKKNIHTDKSIKILTKLSTLNDTIENKNFFTVKKLKPDTLISFFYDVFVRDIGIKKEYYKKLYDETKNLNVVYVLLRGLRGYDYTVYFTDEQTGKILKIIIPRGDNNYRLITLAPQKKYTLYCNSSAVFVKGLHQMYWTSKFEKLFFITPSKGEFIRLTFKTKSNKRIETEE